ncbi:MAG: hypothetical protein DMD82_09150 [Candidatus Rokuibacteriota bacterium]|nr:MAG: hypothetical protein DMD82_09150 [Candidatus Rokubacteria bacterium]
MGITGSITASNKTYDASTAATIATRSLSGVLGTDAVSYAGGTATFGNKNVGTGKTVTGTGLSLSGADAGSYTVNSTATTTANITALGITGSITANGKTYDANTAATIATRSLSGVIAPDVVSYVGGTASFNNKNVGTGKTVTATSLSLSGADAGNYTVNSTATTTADITALGITGSITANSKTYDANTAATIATRSLTGVLGTDAVSYTGGTATFGDKNVGTGKTVTGTGLSLSGADAGNYTVNSTATTTADIAAQGITGSITANSKTYDATTAATIATRSLTGVLGTDAVSYTGGTATFGDKNVGTSKSVAATGLSLSGADAGNYTVNSTATTTADITVLGIAGSITANSKTYDASTVATIATRSLTGVLGTDAVSYTGGTATFGNKNVGTGKTVTGTGLGLSGADAGNYTVNTTATTTANIIALGITGSITAGNKVYDGSAAATILTRALAGVLGTDVVSYVGGVASFGNKNVGTGKTVTGTGLSLSGADAGNYTVNSTATTLADITLRSLTVSATGVNKVYDGVTAATVTLSDNRVSGDVFTDSYSGAAFADANVGVGKPVSVSGISIAGTDAPNYSANTTASTTANIAIAGTTALATATAGSPQYSDMATFTATLTPASLGSSGPTATSVTFFVGTQNMGTVSLVAGGGTLTATLTTPLLEPVPFGASPTLQMAPGSHAVSAVFGGINPNFSVTNPSTSLTISPEDARATYTGALFASTSSASSGAATVTLSATIQDITAVTGDPAYDANSGDIRNAKVTFINRDNSSVIASNLPVGLVSASDTKTGTATFNWNVDIGTASSQSYTIGVIVNNYYTRNVSDEDAVITVSKPLSDFITGGGYLLLTSSAGLYAGGAGTRNNFGFNVKYNKSNTNLQGNINTIVRNSGRVYQIKGNSMTSLSVNATSTSTGTAVFNGKASIQDITDPLSPIGIDGNATLQVTMTDAGEPGTDDKIGITVWNKAGGMWFSSKWDGTKTVEQLLAGGNLQVRSSSVASKGVTTASGAPIAESAEPIPTEYAMFQNFPNPFRVSTQFRFDLPERSRVRIGVYDILGREIASLADGEMDAGRYQRSWQGVDRAGRSLTAGVYFLRMQAIAPDGAKKLVATRKVLLAE